MIVLDSNVKKLEVVLAGTVTTAQGSVVAAFVDVSPTAYTPGAYDTATNDTTAVPVVYAPATLGSARQVKFLSVYNGDSASMVVTVRLNHNSTLRPLVKVTLAAGSSLVYTDGEGFRVINTAGEILQS